MGRAVPTNSLSSLVKGERLDSIQKSEPRGKRKQIRPGEASQRKIKNGGGYEVYEGELEKEGAEKSNLLWRLQGNAQETAGTGM